MSLFLRNVMSTLGLIINRKSARWPTIHLIKADQWKAASSIRVNPKRLERRGGRKAWRRDDRARGEGDEEERKM